jgi:3-hydroxyisobutyrate dehydrogenase
MRIGFIGTGVMGSPIVRHLSKHHQVVIYNRSPEKALALKDVASIASTIEEISSSCEVIFTMVGFPKDVDSVYDIMIRTAKKGTVCVDLTTSSPSLAKQWFHKGQENNIHILDCPVTGGEIGAIQGTLTLMVGGEKEAYEKVLLLLQLFGKKILYMGEAGNGQYTKLSNQIAIAGSLVSLAESLAFARKQNLDTTLVLDVLTSGAASSFSATQYGQKMVSSNFKPGFYVKHFLKDLTLAVEASIIPLPVASTVKDLFETLAKDYGNDGVQSIISLIEKQH